MTDGDKDFVRLNVEEIEWHRSLKTNLREQPDEFQFVTENGYRLTRVDQRVLIIVRADNIIVTSATCRNNHRASNGSKIRRN